MTVDFSRHGGKALALAVPAGLAVVLWLTVIVPVADIIGAKRDRNALLERILDSYRATASAETVVAADLKTHLARERTQQGLVAGSTSALAAAGLQAEIKSIVERNGGSIHSTQNLPPQVSNGLESIKLNYNLAAPLNRYGEIIYEIESHKPYLFLDNVQITVPDTVRVSEATDPNVSIRWTVVAYRWAAP